MKIKKITVLENNKDIMEIIEKNKFSYNFYEIFILQGKYTLEILSISIKYNRVDGLYKFELCFNNNEIEGESVEEIEKQLINKFI